MKVHKTIEMDDSNEKNEVDKKDSGHSFQDYYKRAVSPILVLKMLSEKPMYSYQMVQELKKRSDNRYSVFLYPVTYRLLKQGYIKEHGKVISDDNRTRNYYSITPEGEVYLKSLLREYEHMQDIVYQVLHSTGD